MRALTLALCLTLAIAPAAEAGPPWITIEFRPGSFAGVLMVHTYHHGDPMMMPLSGTAEGIVNGKRRSVPLVFERGDAPNLFTVKQTWGAEGVWVLDIAVTGQELGAGAVVGLDRNGEPAFTRFPRSVNGATRPATTGEVNALLRALDAGSTPGTLGRTGWGAIMTRMGVPLALIIVVVIGIAKAGGAVVARMRRRTGIVTA